MWRVKLLQMNPALKNDVHFLKFAAGGVHDDLHMWREQGRIESKSVFKATNRVPEIKKSYVIYYLIKQYLN